MPELQVLDLNVLVADTEKMLRRLIEEKVRLITILQPGLSRVRADPGQIDQIIMNLAVNARDAMPKGGSLTLQTRNLELGAAYTKAPPGLVGPICPIGRHRHRLRDDAGSAGAHL
jgi:two-component system cell cycle sensor histidine kinase/response regulator CckA